MTDKKKLHDFILKFFYKNFNISLKEIDFRKKNFLEKFNIDSMNIMYFLTSLERFLNRKIKLNIILESSLNQIISKLKKKKSKCSKNL